MVALIQNSGSLRQRFAGLPRVIGVIQSHGDDLGGRDWRQRADALELCGLLIKRRRSENVALQTEDLAIHHFGVKNLVTLLKPADCCHRADDT